jgi:hypothetical protein
MEDYNTEKIRLPRLTGASNYHPWAPQAKAHLRGKRIWKYVEKGLSELTPELAESTSESISKPTPEQVEKEEKEEAGDSQASSFIMGAVSKSILLQIVNLPTAKEKWDKLAVLYAPKDSTSANTKIGEFYNYKLTKGDKILDIVT